MAEIKRQSVAGKIAIPRTGTASPAQPAQTTAQAPDNLDALNKVVGCKIKLVTSAPHSQTYEGELYAVCTVSRLVAISTRPTSAKSAPATAQARDYHVIPSSRVQSFEVLSSATTGDLTSAPPVDHVRLTQRVADRVRKLKEEEQNRGKGVTAEGQAIFDSFKRINTPIRWHNQEMIVYDAVIITPPYTVDDCKGAKEKQETLNRVKKVLEGERRKLKEKQDREKRSSLSSGGLRKGG